MNRKIWIVPLILCAASASLYADDITLDWTSSGNNPVGNYFVSPYQATEQVSGTVLTLFCIDFNHEVAPPQEWQAQIYALNNHNVPFLQYGVSDDPGQATAWQEYSEAAWLINQLNQVTPLDAAGLHEQAVYQYAAWGIFLDAAHTAAYNNSVSAAGGAPFAAEISAALQDASNAVAGGYVPVGLEVVTPYPKGLPDSTQEFLTFAPVPEPSGVALLLTALAGGFSLTLRKLRSATQRE